MYLIATFSTCFRNNLSLKNQIIFNYHITSMMRKASECNCFGTPEYYNKSGIKKTKNLHSDIKNFTIGSQEKRLRPEKTASLEMTHNTMFKQKKSLRRQKPNTPNQYHSLKNQQLQQQQSYRFNLQPKNYSNAFYLTKTPSSEYNLNAVVSTQNSANEAWKQEKQITSEYRQSYRKRNYQPLPMRVIADNPYGNQRAFKPQQTHDTRHCMFPMRPKQYSFFQKCEQIAKPLVYQTQLTQRQIIAKYSLSDYNQLIRETQSISNMNSINDINNAYQKNTSRFSEKSKRSLTHKQQRYEPKAQTFRMYMKQIQSIGDQNELNDDISQVIGHDWMDEQLQEFDKNQRKAKKSGNLTTTASNVRNSGNFYDMHTGVNII